MIVIQVMHDLHVAHTQLEIKNIEIFANPVLICGFRNNDCAILNLKPKIRN